MSKRKLPELLKVRRVCSQQEGVKPFTKETADQKRRIEVCLNEKMGKKR